jgi:hypothetical protein
MPLQRLIASGIVNQERTMQMTEHNTADTLNQAVRQGYDAAREYSDKGIDLAANVSSNVRSFARREPWLALGAAFAIGYSLARMMRRAA